MQNIRPDRERLRQLIVERLGSVAGKAPPEATAADWFAAAAHAVRELLTPAWIESTRTQARQQSKQVYYLSIEFLLGRTLGNALLTLDLGEEARGALRELGLDPAAIEQQEPDPALGNGGLGRLAACFLDSMASIGLPAMGYGLRYDYGMFRQDLDDGWQVERPDCWLARGNPWELRRPDVSYAVRFGGRRGGRGHRVWRDQEIVHALACDMPVPGAGARLVNTLRLWCAEPSEPLDLEAFNRGDYAKAVRRRNAARNIARVLYPDDSSTAGRTLRLRQEYFFVSASLQDILRRFRAVHEDWSRLPALAAVHLNDTHPALAVPELMRLLVDEHRLDWDAAWGLTRRVISYTNHTLMPEALESWPVGLLAQVVPRPLEIIERLQEQLAGELAAVAADASGAVRFEQLAPIDAHAERVRMGHLSVLASHHVNGVSAVHSGLVREQLFPGFAQLYPERFCNVTNGITPRRWLLEANPALAALIDERIGRGWREDLMALSALRAAADDPAFRAAFRAVKHANKARLAEHIAGLGVQVSSDSLFDVQIKRLHEYKRQLLNVLQLIARYRRIIEDADAEVVPRTVIFAGKAASAYWVAKLIIKLINDVAAVVNNDVRVGERLKVVFLPDYGVSLAQRIIPAADLSQQISTAGTEASGTGNMKLALNGALTIGTEDGANIEIRDAAGADNIFIFGNSLAQVSELRAAGYDPHRFYQGDAELAAALDAIGDGSFCPAQPERFRGIIERLLAQGDYYQLLADFRPYVEAQARVDAVWREPEEWTRRAILNVAAMGWFSSDRSVREYAREIWQVQPLGPGH